VDLRHFKLGRSIGRGAFGKVKVVVKRDTKKLYALKYINKDACIKKRAYRNIFRERNLLEALEHPFIVNLRYAFQDDENMFMVLDLMLGGDMRFHLNRMGKFTERMAVFYAAELASALMYLHDARILHRDIKPDNILLDADGHVHLTDFNCATVMEPGKKVTSETGTAGYMAPEVYGGGGYNEAVDWWSLGVVLWECLHGERPFYGSRMDKLIWRVKHAPLRFSDEMSRRMRALLEGVRTLLERDPARRLGASGAGHADVLSHPAFRRLDFSLLLEKQIEPPYVPDTTTLNFEPRYELEELLLEENPLHAKPRKVRGADAAPLSRELRLMDAEFMPFDYAKRT
ncbi:kinase-like protein, partial [Blastocladiella britannica]